MNSHSLQERLSPIEEDLAGIAVFQYLDSPIEVSPEAANAYIDRIVARKNYNAEERAAFSKQFLPSEGCPRSFWDHGRQGDTVTYGRFDESMQTLLEFVQQNGPFAGIFGFSQGSIVAALLCHMMESPPFKMAVLCSGPLPRDHAKRRYISGKSKVPALTVIGNFDRIVTPEMSLQLAACFEKSEVVRFDGGHRVPSADQEARQSIVDFIKRHLD